MCVVDRDGPCINCPPASCSTVHCMTFVSRPALLQEGVTARYKMCFLFYFIALHCISASDVDGHVKVSPVQTSCMPLCYRVRVTHPCPFTLVGAERNRGVPGRHALSGAGPAASLFFWGALPRLQVGVLQGCNGCGIHPSCLRRTCTFLSFTYCTHTNCTTNNGATLHTAVAGCTESNSSRRTSEMKPNMAHVRVPAVLLLLLICSWEPCSSDGDTKGRFSCCLTSSFSHSVSM